LIRARSGFLGDRKGHFDLSDSDPKKDGGRRARVIADEERLGRRDLLRLFAWGLCAVLAVAAVAILYRSPDAIERSGEATQLLATRAIQAEQAAKANGLEARRLAAAIETLNSDRDRLFGRLASLETALATASDSIRKLETAKTESPPAATAVPDPPSPPVVSAAPQTKHATEATPPAPEVAEPPVETTASIPPQPIAAAPSSIQTLPIPDARFETSGQVEKIAPQTEFGLELGKAASPDGLRALWRKLARKHASELEGLGPIVVVRERRGGFDLHLVAGPIRDAATAARLCASLIDTRQACRTTVFDGQRLSLSGESAPEKPRRARRKSTQAAPLPATRPASPIASMMGLQ
jgi:hypothetical protein